MRNGPVTLRLGLATALSVFACDQMLKWYLLAAYQLGTRGRVEVTPFFDLVLVWNRGISYGLFQQGPVGRWLLVALTLAAIVGIFLWLMRVKGRVLALGLGLILGGAAGNLVDRVVFGAVADFISLHAGGFYWYVFNLADCAIVAGVAALLYDSLLGSHKDAAKDT